MKKQQIASGVARIVKVIGIGIFILGEFVIYGSAMAIRSVTYTDLYGGQITTPGKPFDWNTFLTYSFWWVLISYGIYALAIYIVKGFKAKEKE